MSRFNSSRLNRMRAAALSITLLFGLETLPRAAIAAPHAPPRSPAAPTPASTSIEPPPSEELALPPETTPPASPAAEILAPGTATATNVTAPPRAAAPVALDLSAPAPTGHPETPLYEKWWFWTAIAAVAVTTVVIVAATSGPTQPRTDLGNMVAF